MRCHSHRLKVLLAAVAQPSADASAFFNTITLLHSFMCGTQQHACFLDTQRQLYPDLRPLQLEHGCDTRWNSRSTASSVHSVILEEYAEEGGQSQTDAQLLLQSIQTKKLIFLLELFKELLKKYEFATKGLQSTNVSVTDTVDIIENLKVSLTDIHSSHSCDSEFLKMLAMTNNFMGDNNIDSWDISLSTHS